MESGQIIKNRLAGAFFLLAWGVGPAAAELPALSGALSAVVPLTEVVQRVQAYPNLRQEIRLARIAAAGGAAPVCRAWQLGPQWTALKGRTTGPYSCRIGARTLDITTRLTFFDRARHKLAAQLPDLAARAAALSETRFVWRWH